jgi:putative sugar O-methyltransferase
MIAERLREILIRRGQSAAVNQLLAADRDRLDSMLACLRRGDARARPSLYWEELNKLNLTQIGKQGYANFKRTAALNYFTWAIMFPWNSQVAFLRRFSSMHHIGSIIWRALLDTDTAIVGRARRFAYDLITLLLWEYIYRVDLPAELLALREPMEGNPLLVFPRPGVGLTQDLGNSILEYQSFRGFLPSNATVLELGAGYGRNAFVILKDRPDAKLIIIDVPPALWISERYLSSVFPDKKIFKFREFADFGDIAEEFNRADVVFLISTQITLLPAGIADLILNVSSLHEMRPDQIFFYFEQFDRLLRNGGHMYTKQWRRAKVLFEHVTLVESDYPIPRRWVTVFSRQAAVQTKFYEALYKKDDRGNPCP